MQGKNMIEFRNKVIKNHNTINGLLVLNNNLSKDLMMAIRREALAIVMLCDNQIDWDLDDEIVKGAVKDE